MLLVFAFEKLGHYDFSVAGIYPRKATSLLGIITMPFVHSGAKHLFSNIPAFLFLSSLVYLKYKAVAGKSMLNMWIISGILLWAIGRPSYHIGCSGIIYALSMFVFCAGIINRQRQMMALSLVVVFLYGGMVWSMFPQTTPANISWEGHVSGAIAGLITALLFCEGKHDPEPEEEDEKEPNFDWRGKDTADGDVI